MSKVLDAKKAAREFVYDLVASRLNIPVSMVSESTPLRKSALSVAMSVAAQFNTKVEVIGGSTVGDILKQIT